ncbi:hypothetical protein SOCE26_050780 [Sorangium cellulosum]|uniref:Uncharacterized protein n=1 Tax=Sorangium cellulosum TaxID=56 RepID=A0A2L0EWF7_SORCE|nr:neuraminidase-like domain-containing protein [Sorangium cellulosum]AUX43626.1 hypothetical protein SOCE26_050780 [Sorangium cellulosum]
MPKAIIIRLHPEEPVSGVGFGDFLADLVITAVDLSLGAPSPTSAGVRQLGQASFTSSVATTRIVQHTYVPAIAPEPAAVATAVIELIAPWPEHEDPDVWLRVERNGSRIANIRVHYNTPQVTLTAAELANKADYPLLEPTSLYLTLPPPGREIDPTDAHVELPSDGSPPNFADLLTAVRLVLQHENSGATPSPAIEDLTAAQCRHVAFELVYERTLFPFAGPATGNLAFLYTEPQASSDGNRNARRQFEANLLSYEATHDARAQLLTGYVVALAAALRCEQRSIQADLVGLTVPVRLDPNVSPTGKVRDVEVLLVNGPDFVVPAEFFYALTAELPAAVSFETRYRSVTAKSEAQNVSLLEAAFDRGVIAEPATPTAVPAVGSISRYHAARRLRLLGMRTGSRYLVEAQVDALVRAWLTFPSAGAPSRDIREFWQNEVTVQPLLRAHLRLLLAVITEQQDPSALVDALRNELGADTVEELVAVTLDQWSELFENDPSLLPANTLPGTTQERVRAFVRRLERFFDFSLGGTSLVQAQPSEVPTFGPSPADPLGKLLDALGGLPITPSGAAFEQALLDVFPADEAARAWLRAAAEALSELFTLTQGVNPPSFQFSVMEALYARGFTSRARIAALTLADFRASLVGTVAYPIADMLHEEAGGSDRDEPPGATPFRPINPDGQLVNCVPPAHRSSLGPVAYLQELLQISDRSTCRGDEAFESGEASEVTLSELVAARRGPVGELLATWANTNVCLPVVDLVNESLERLVTEVAVGTAQPAGAVHDTSQTSLHHHLLATPAHQADPAAHDPVLLFGVLPEHSSPATPVALPAAYEVLKTDFSAPNLPYSEPLAIVRAYLRRLCTSRFEIMRVFRRDITEFVLRPGAPEPTGFPAHQWRYPVRFEIACEYLGITPEESTLFTGGEGAPSTAELYGSPGGESFPGEVLPLPSFLSRLGLDYCELVELAQLGFVDIGIDGPLSPPSPDLPACEPCCPDDYRLVIRSGQEGLSESLRRIAIFVRLWRKLQALPCARYALAEFGEIARELGLSSGSGELNPDFLRQLVAFQMLCDDLALRLRDSREGSAAVSGLHLHLLALWRGPEHSKWAWAVGHVIERIGECARKKHHCAARSPRFLKLLSENLDPLSALAGFDPAVSAHTWFARPSHTLRFVEVLQKIYASRFAIGDLLFALRSEPHLAGEDPLPLQPDNEAREDPLATPDDACEGSLWRLRRKLLEVEVDDEHAQKLGWTYIVRSLRDDFGLSTDASGEPLLSLARHFFPHVLHGTGGAPGATAASSYRVPLSNTSPGMWNSPDGPFDYDPVRKELGVSIPLTDQAVLEKLQRIRQLRTAAEGSAEQEAVRALYFAPRRELARFAFLFPDFGEAERSLIEGPDEAARFAFFQRAFAVFQRRAVLIAQHLSEHVASVTGEPRKGGDQLAKLVLRHLFADENFALSAWEADSGVPPVLTWSDPAQAGALSALVGLVGTGLLGEYRAFAAGASADVLYRELRSPSRAFGEARDFWNAPVPTVLPALDLALSAAQGEFVGVRNGFALRNDDGTALGGAQGFAVTWNGVLLVEQGGDYTFHAGVPRPDGETPLPECPGHLRWRVSLRRGQRSWVLLSHHWDGDPASSSCSDSLSLRRGAYDLTIELIACPPAFERAESTLARQTGFELAYEGPDSADQVVAIPNDKLYVAAKNVRLGAGIGSRQDGFVEPAAYLNERYYSTLRDVRRTYQRAFRALLFAWRHGLHAEPSADDGQSELGYLLSKAESFAGITFYPSGGAFAPHRAWLDFDLLPVDDNYHPPAGDQRQHPSRPRAQALFDWWERIFDYTMLRTRANTAPERPAWLLFHEAAERHPDDPAHLLRHIGVDLSHAPLVLRYDPDFSLSGTGSDLENERWPVRIFHAELLLERVRRKFTVEDIRLAQPDRWAADNPAASGGTENLTRFVRRGYLENGQPRRYLELGSLNDPLRESARAALLAYLCRLDRVALPWGGFARNPRDLSDLLLIDVEAGLCQRASRIEEAVSAVQAFVRRTLLGLEPDWLAPAELPLVWERRFKTLVIWQACKGRVFYRENWIEWDELATSRRSEGFRLFEDQLRSTNLSIATPASLTQFEAPTPPPAPGHALVQAREPSVTRFVHPPQVEALGLMGTRDRHGRPTWLSDVNRSGLPSAVSPPNDVVTVLQLEHGERLPLWIESAIRLGARFLRVAAAGDPPASNTYRVHEPLPGCCVQCGTIHPPTLDEYYFWLTDAKHFAPVTQDANVSSTEAAPEGSGPASAWRSPEDLPTLLDWKGHPTLHLCWARVHNGELKQPRRSSDGLRLAADVTTRDLTLQLVGRFADSLKFEVVREGAPLSIGAPADPGAEVNATGLHGGDAPGFRYDLVTDSAEVLPLLEDPEEPGPFFNELAAYPYFLHHTPGAPLYPTLVFSLSVVAAGSLRAHCRYQAALGWYAAAASVHEDAAWCPDGQDGDERGTCCGSGEVSAPRARRRALYLSWLETSLAWADSLLRVNTPESFQQARVVLDSAARLLGPAPKTVASSSEGEDDSVQTVTTFFAEGVPLNPRLLALYERVADRRALVHACLSGRRLQNGKPQRDLPYFGEQALFDGWRASESSCDDEGLCCLHGGLYRLANRLPKALELANETRNLGAALLSAFEKGDAEYLSSLRATHERQILSLALDIRKNQWRETDWQVQALDFAKQIAQTRRRYTQGLIDAGLNTGERDFQDLTEAANGVRTAGNVSEIVAEIMHFIPDVHVGTVNFTTLPLGSKIAYVFQAVARIARTTSDILTATAGLRLTEGGWARREDDWRHQVEVLDLEIEQIERQRLGAERRRDMALRELNNQQRQLEQVGEVQDFLRDKFTSHELYLWLQKETAALYHQLYEVALHEARMAQRAYNLELGHESDCFLPTAPWDDLHEGLLAGERLSVALRQMESAYLCKNLREYELTKHISLRCFSPVFLMQLKTTGCTEIELPEWLFDLDYPGHYMRRIRSVSLTLPCVTGPYQGIQCRLTLLSSRIRVDPRLRGPDGRCCDEPPVVPTPDPCACHDSSVQLASAPTPLADAYAVLPGDSRVVQRYGAHSAIATSSGQNDAGLFEVSFADPRYLPFEYEGAVSRWRIELPLENNYFDLDTLSDCVMHLRYTAREGGSVLAAAARASASRALPDGGVRLFEVRREWPDLWARLSTPHKPKAGGPRTLELRWGRDSFAFLPGQRELHVVRLELLFELEQPRAVRGECTRPCAEVVSDARASHTLVLSVKDPHGCGCGEADCQDCGCRLLHIDCVASEAWPGLYHGALTVELPVPPEECTVAELRFPERVGKVARAYVLCGYRAERLPSASLPAGGSP